jgi:hypothetical protein
MKMEGFPLHKGSPLQPVFSKEITKDTKVKNTKLERKSFFVLFVPSW